LTVTENTENEDDGRRGDGGVDARVLGRLLHAMPFLEMLPSAERIAEFLTAALADVPGVKSCAVHLGESAAQDGRPGRRSDPAAGATLSRGRWTVPVETGGQIYGDFVLEVDDEPSLNPYLPYLTNLAGSVALITENRLRRDRLAAALAEVRVSAAANARLAAAVDSSDDAILTKTLEGRIVTWNAGAERMYGYAADEIIGESVSRLLPPDSGEQLGMLLDRVRRGERVEHYDAVRLRKDGRRIDVSLSLSPVKDAAGVLVGVSAIARDVTKRRRAEQEVSRLNDELEQRVFARTAQRDAAEHSAHAGSFRWGLGTSRSAWSPEFYTLFDVEPGDFGGDVEQAFAARVHPDDRAGLLRKLESVESLGVLPPHDFRVVRRGGEERIMRSGGTAERDAVGKATALVGYVEDVTEQRRAEEANARLAAIVDTSDDGIFSSTLEGRIVTWNTGAERMFGYAAEEIIGQSGSLLTSPGSEDEFAELRACVSRGDGVRRPDAVCLRRDGSALRVSLSVSPLRDKAGVIIGASVIAHDVTEERRAEAALLEGAERHRAILQTAMDGFWLGDAQGRLIEVNEAYCRMSGYRPEELQGMLISDLESAETGEETRTHMQTLVVTGEARFETRHRRKDGSVFDVAVSVQYHPGEGGQFVAFLQDISARKQAEEDLKQSAHDLREQLFDTVKAMGAIVGVRDPYTATHELRVTGLAVAIAMEMGLDQEPSEGLTLAAEVHDIGKVAVPAEILTKPGKLSENEFLLVREHAPTGSEILSTIHFRQPVAAIVAQHHERFDGSGYPDGLAGDAIMLEARILAVADVVEAMASHRPYRAALPLEVALAEIEEGAGTRYDPEVCAAVLRLFRERGFAFAA